MGVEYAPKMLQLPQATNPPPGGHRMIITRHTGRDLTAEDLNRQINSYRAKRDAFAAGREARSAERYVERATGGTVGSL